uniref:Uncharacterized protein n=1 Tax=Escherichia coli TaxID=562 RepID=A0A075MJ62_ECOLX|nr:hypothetical protein [Escherichia coli]
MEITLVTSGLVRMICFDENFIGVSPGYQKGRASFEIIFVHITSLRK